MISQTSALRQTLRFLDLDRFPQDKTELVKAFMNSFDKDVDAENFSQDWIENNSECPKPSHVYERGRSIRSRINQEEFWERQRLGIKYLCAACSDSGYIDLLNEEGEYTARRCECLLEKISKEKEREARLQ